MWILPNHKSDLDLDTFCAFFEKSVLFRSKPSNAKTWKIRLRKESLVVGRIPRHQLLNRGLVKSKCLQTSQNHQTEREYINTDDFKEWLDFCKLEYKVRSNSTKKIWATPTTQEAEHNDLVLNNQGRRISPNGKHDHSLNLADQARMFFTPRARDYKGHTNNWSNTLPDHVELDSHNWPTPRSDKDYNSEDANKWIARFIKFKGGISSSLALTVDLEVLGITKEKLQNELKSWSTPAARDYKGTQGRTNKEESLGDLPGQTEGPWSTWKSDLPQDIKTAKELSKKLNPRWVENLMGLPIGWVNVKAYMNKSGEK